MYFAVYDAGNKNELERTLEESFWNLWMAEIYYGIPENKAKEQIIFTT